MIKRLEPGFYYIDTEDVSVTFSYDSKRHKWRISINFEEIGEFTRKEGETIIRFLDVLCEFSKKLSMPEESKNSSILKDATDYLPKLMPGGI